MRSLLKIKFLVIASCVLLGTAFMQGQVVMGSTAEPLPGAILQLETANLGLLLPRVNLTSASDLFPMLEDPNNTGSYAAEYVKADQDPLHVGLVVYNVNPAFTDGVATGPGVYVWNGSAWQKVTLQ